MSPVMRRRLIVASAVVLAPIAMLVWTATRLPSFEAVKRAYVPSDAWLLARNGEVLATRRVDTRVRRLPWVSLEDISPVIPASIIHAEDRRFWRHPGVDPIALAGAVRDDVLGRGWRGASTIPMQLAAFLDPSARGAPRRGAFAKLRQIWLALALELRWSRHEILEAYLNRAGFHGDTEGIAAATQALFAHEPRTTSPDEAWILAASLRSPIARPAVIARRACRLSGVDRAGCAQLAFVTAQAVARPSPATAPLELAPHLAVHLLTRPGEQVRSTIDARLQREVLDTLRSQLASLSGRRVRDGAALVVANDTGEVLAYVGSAGLDSTAGQVDGAQAPRQAGSTLKPFLYAIAIGRGVLTPASLLDDSPLSISVPGGLYTPQDYDHAFRGLVSLRVALGGSLNVPAVRTLGLVGPESLHRLLTKLGYGRLAPDPDVYGQSLALGTADVTLAEQVAAYRALAVAGHYRPLSYRLGERTVETPVIDSRTAWIIGNILADGRARSTTFGLDGPLTTRTWSAVKTGTSKDMRDNWCLGFSKRYTVGVWVGNFEGDPMHDVSGVAGAAPAWSAIIDRLEAGADGRPPPAPAGVVAREVHFAGHLEPPRTEWFLGGTEATDVTPAPARHLQPRIQSPTANEIVAFDPDIPRSNQRMLLSAVPSHPGLSWRVDDILVGGRGDAAWPLVRGRHRVTLVDTASRETLDEVAFDVR